MRRIAALAAALLPASSMACSLLYGPDGFDARDGDPAFETDGRGGKPGAPDAMLDPIPTSPGDLGAGDPASADADGGAPPPSAYCSAFAPMPLFCDALDESLVAWSRVSPRATGVALDGTAFVSPPRSLHISTSGTQPTYIRRTFPGPYRWIHVSLDLRVAQAAADDNTYLVELAVGTNAVIVLADFGGRNARVQERAASGTGGLTFVDHPRGGAGGPLDPTSWRRVELEIDFSTTPPSVSMRLGGNVVVAREALAASWAPARTTLSVGPTFLGTPSARELVYDNVVFDAR